jgi:hypothetical protein
MSLETGAGLTDLMRSYSSASFTLKIDNTSISSGDLMSFFQGPANNKPLKGRKDLRLELKCDVSGTADLFRINYIDLKTGKGASLGLSGVVEGIAHPSSAKCSVSFRSGPITTVHLRELLTLTGSEINIPEFDPVSIEGSVDTEKYFREYGNEREHKSEG